MKDIKQRLAQVKATNELYRTPVSKYSTFPSFTLIGSQSYEHGLDAAIKSFTPVESPIIEVMCAWISSNVGLFTGDFAKLYKSLTADNPRVSLERLSNNMQAARDGYALFKKHLKRKGAAAKGTVADGVVMYGDQAYTNESISFDSFIIALKLVKGLHPFTAHVFRATVKSLSVNAIDFEPINQILGRIDFPITSVANLLTALGLQYVDNSVFIDKNLLVGVVSPWVLVWVDCNPKFYKLGTAEAICDAIDNQYIAEKLDADTSRTLGFISYENGE